MRLYVLVLAAGAVAGSGLVTMVNTPLLAAEPHAEQPDARASAEPADLALLQRLANIETRLALLEARVVGVTHEAKANASPAAPEASTPQAAAPEPAATGAPEAGILADPQFKGLPQPVGAKLAELHPAGRIVEVGRDGGDGYWWIEVRQGGRLFDVEITDDGVVRKNRATRG